MFSQPGGQGQYGPALAPRHRLSLQHYKRTTKCGENEEAMSRIAIIASDVLYTLGSSMKGVPWEVLAVPRSESRQSGLRGCSSTATIGGATLPRLMLVRGGTLRPGERSRTA